jgi:hypothetical protein
VFLKLHDIFVRLLFYSATTMQMTMAYSYWASEATCGAHEITDPAKRSLWHLWTAPHQRRSQPGDHPDMSRRFRVNLPLFVAGHPESMLTGNPFVASWVLNTPISIQAHFGRNVYACRPPAKILVVVA